MTPTPRAMAIEQIRIEVLSPDEVHLPDPANPRRIGEPELEALCRSIRQYGLVQSARARRADRVVIGGHQRLCTVRRGSRKLVQVLPCRSLGTASSSVPTRVSCGRLRWPVRCVVRFSLRG